MPTPIERAEQIIQLVRAAGDAVSLLQGTDGDAARRLAEIAAAQVTKVIRDSAARSIRARRARARGSSHRTGHRAGL